MTDKITLALPVGVFFTVRAALERWQLILDGYAKTDLTPDQERDVLKFKVETKSALEAIADARSQYLRGPGAGNPRAPSSAQLAKKF